MGLAADGAFIAFVGGFSTATRGLQLCCSLQHCTSVVCVEAGSCVGVWFYTIFHFWAP
jgi:hypothetical protein